MEREITKIIKVCLSIISSLCFCYFFSSKIPEGKLRLISLFPVLIFFTLIPLYFSYLFPVGITTVFISWLCNFKLLLFAFDQGPLSCDPHMSLSKFVTIATLPIKINPNNNYPSTNSSLNSPKLPLNLPTKVLLFAIFVCLNDYNHVLHPKLLIVQYCCMSYLVVDILFGASNFILRNITNMELEPPSDEPYLATSLQDFWGRRWNLMVTSTLRHTIYKPVRDLLRGPLGQWASVAAILVTFLVSGLIHELLFYYISSVRPTWEVTFFFLLHGVCLVWEIGLKSLANKRFQLHWLVSMLLTLGLVMATASWLFFQPLARNGSIDRAIEECKMVLNFVKERLIRITMT